MRTPIGDVNETKKVAFFFIMCKVEKVKNGSVKVDQEWDIQETSLLSWTTIKEKVYIQSEYH